MKIGHLDKQPPVAPTVSERKGPAAAGDKPQAEASAKVDLSASAAALAGDPAVDGSFDQAKVERIAQAIRDGKFEVNAEAIADKLIANAQELLGKTGG
jgi:negative regulator of flagellin synthesis FlgM